MKTFKFGQLLTKLDMCDRDREARLLKKISRDGGRAVVYGSRRFGKTSLVKNIVMHDFLNLSKRSLGIYADFFQIDSLQDVALRLQVAVEHALSERAKTKTFLKKIQNYIKHFRIEITLDPLSGSPKVTLLGKDVKDEKNIHELFAILKSLSSEYKTLLVLDEFQDITRISGLEANLRSEIQSLSNTAVILLGSKRHLLREIFQDESRPFYGFGVDVEVGKIERQHWLPYMKERFSNFKLTVDRCGVDTICEEMRDVPNSIQELSQWITLNDERGHLESATILRHIAELIENKSSRYFERLASYSVKERAVLLATAQVEPVSAISSAKFVRETGISATATKAAMLRFADQGVLDHTDLGYVITDPIFGIFLRRQFIHT